MNHEHPPAESRPQPKHRAEAGPTSLDSEQITAANEVDTDLHADAFIADVVETFGWQQELNQLLQGRSDLQLAVTFDRDAIYQFANDRYEVIRTNDTEVIHLFTRWP